MAVDSSAVIAILTGEAAAERFIALLGTTDRCLISAVNAHETASVLRIRYGAVAVVRFWQFLAETEIEVAPFDESQARVAAEAFDRYGKGIDPRARLNLADCAAYALAKTMAMPLLFKGNDFAATDIPTAA